MYRRSYFLWSPIIVPKGSLCFRPEYCALAVAEGGETDFSFRTNVYDGSNAGYLPLFLLVAFHHNLKSHPKKFLQETLSIFGAHGD